MSKRNIAPPRCTPRAKAATSKTPFTQEQIDFLADCLNEVETTTLRKVVELLSQLEKGCSKCR
jgi:hypothetical protein